MDRAVRAGLKSLLLELGPTPLSTVQVSPLCLHCCVIHRRTSYVPYDDLAEIIDRDLVSCFPAASNGLITLLASSLRAKLLFCLLAGTIDGFQLTNDI